MRSGALLLLAVLLAVFLASGQCASGSADDDGDDHASSSKSDEQHDSGDEDQTENNDEHADGNEGGDDAGEDEGEKDGSASDDGPTRAEAMKQHLESEGLHVKEVSTATSDNCADHSYGEVADYLADHPCEGMQRAWYEVVDDQDNEAVVSVAWVTMPDDEAAAELQQVVDRPGTGNMTELSTEDSKYQDVNYSGSYYRSGRDGSTIYSVQAEPLADDDGSRELARRASGDTAPD